MVVAANGGFGALGLKIRKVGPGLVVESRTSLAGGLWGWGCHQKGRGVAGSDGGRVGGLGFLLGLKDCCNTLRLYSGLWRSEERSKRWFAAGGTRRDFGLLGRRFLHGHRGGGK